MGIACGRSPGAFIDYAEVTGLALPMTVSLMQQVKADLGALCGDMPDLKISINLFEVGVHKVALQQSQANQDAIKRVKYELYVGYMEMDSPALGMD